MHALRPRSRANCRFGDSEKPLLVSVRCGARERMPGMLDTVLNVGLNAKTVEARPLDSMLLSRER